MWIITPKKLSYHKLCPYMSGFISGPCSLVLRTTCLSHYHRILITRLNMKSWYLVKFLSCYCTVFNFHSTLDSVSHICSLGPAMLAPTLLCCKWLTCVGHLGSPSEVNIWSPWILPQSTFWCRCHLVGHKMMLSH